MDRTVGGRVLRVGLRVERLLDDRDEGNDEGKKEGKTNRRVTAPRHAVRCPDDPSHFFSAEACACQRLSPSC